MSKLFLRRGAVLLVLVLLLSSLMIGCASTGGGDETTAPLQGETTSAETEGETSAPEASIAVSDLASYTIIYPEGVAKDIFDKIRELANAINARYGVMLSWKDDFVKAGTSFAESEYEILVGDCKRDQTELFRKTLRADDYGYAMQNKKLVFLGNTMENTIKAIDEFIAVLQSDAASDEVFFTSSNAVTIRGRYTHEIVTINGVELSDYAIIYPQKDKALAAAATYLSENLLNTYRYVVPAYADSATHLREREIWIGDLARETEGVLSVSLENNQHAMAVTGSGALWLMGSSVPLVYRSIELLMDSFEGDLTEGAQVLNFTDEMILTCESATLRAMSFNIRCNEFTAERIELVFRMIDLYAPDTIGFQEVTVAWYNKLRERLGDRYGSVGVGRNADHSGEASPVFYLKEKFKLIESGTKWMTSTPDIAGSKIPESSLPRVYTYAVLESLETGKQFIHVNTHLEHTSDAARRIQVQYLIDYLKSYNERGIQYVLTGDFNTAAGTEAYKTVTNSGLRDASAVAKKVEKGTTYHGYGTTDKIIDFIFVTSGIYVESYKACTETFVYSDGSTAYPSDHNPIIMDYILA